MSGVALEYEVVTVNRAGIERVQPLVLASEPQPGILVTLDGRDWLVDAVEEGDTTRIVAKPARYRLRLRHTDGREELGALRRMRPGSPRLGHSFTTIEDGVPVSWEVMEEAFAHDDQGEPFLDLVAERDYAEAEGDLPDHELEHALARSAEVPDAAREWIDEAARSGLSIELVALEPDEAPDWEEARRYIDALSLDTIGDDLLELCGVDTWSGHEETWLETVQERLVADLESFSADVDGDHDEIEEWDFHNGRVFASVGSVADESDPDRGHGWMCRLLDAGALGAAGFARVRKPELEGLD
ncbi:MAG: hypothetical protein QOF45_2482 [Gaiellaceae bacterium]|nr:hypothetical protein [Gaiellaceae bacterium]